MRDIEQDRKWLEEIEASADAFLYRGIVAKMRDYMADVEALRAKVEELEVQVSTEGVRLSEREGEGNTVTFDRTAFTQFFNNHTALVKRVVKLESERDTLRATVKRLTTPEPQPLGIPGPCVNCGRRRGTPMTRLERISHHMKDAEEEGITHLDRDDAEWLVMLVRDAYTILRDNGDDEDGPEADWIERFLEEA